MLQNGRPAPGSTSRPDGHGRQVEPVAGVPPLAEIGPGLTLLTNWPAPAALVVGDSASPRLLAALRRYGIEATRMPAQSAVHMGTTAGPYVLMTLSADSLPDEVGVLRIRALSRSYPEARKLFDHPATSRDVQRLDREARAGVHIVFDSDDEESVDHAIRSALSEFVLRRERVLAIGAHPGDVEIGCGGTLLGHQGRGDQLSILSLSQGPVVAQQQPSHVQDARITARALGARLVMADLPCSRIDDGAATVDVIEQVVRAVDPTLVYVHSGHDTNQDNRAASSATSIATRAVKQVLAYQSPSVTDEFQPTWFVPIDDVLQRKIDLLQMFGSQAGPNCLEPELVVAGARYWARLRARAWYAEPFEVIRSPGFVPQPQLTPLLVGEAPSPASRREPRGSAKTTGDAVR